MLGLKMKTDPRWVDIVEKNIQEILTDHAWCEQKAASNAISLIVKYPDHTELVTELMAIAREELEHFEMVHEKIKERGYTLGPERKDPYVHDLMKFINKGGNREQALADKLLFSAMIEARSCERFRLLSQEIDDKDLRVFYHELMISEAGHFTTFLNYARTVYNSDKVDQRWQEFLVYEGEIIKNYGTNETMHG